ncbi:hypothetical protein LX32DRAFT_657986 [Colletotrichum zoysiae]|uniref:Uncharacterized protein n=1 Tax=Colletotrichum zoysiae TaxID=1216348 RepID=A0AAD9LXN1_9PEZI|nr:hypothetical protein LX32DRAFT_657986 [Colletotrichum zoysiae]
MVISKAVSLKVARARMVPEADRTYTCLRITSSGGRAGELMIDLGPPSPKIALLCFLIHIVSGSAAPRTLCRDHALVDTKGRPLWLLEAIRRREAPDVEYLVAHEEWHPAQSDWLTAKLRKTWPEPGWPAPHGSPVSMEPPSRPAAVSDDKMAYIRCVREGKEPSTLAHAVWGGREKTCRVLYENVLPRNRLGPHDKFACYTMSSLAPVFQSHIAKWLPDNCDGRRRPIIIHAWIDDDLENHGEEGAMGERVLPPPPPPLASLRPHREPGPVSLYCQIAIYCVHINQRGGTPLQALWDDAAGFRWVIKIVSAVAGLRRRGADIEERTASYVRNVLDRLQSACDARARANDDDSDDVPPVRVFKCLLKIIRRTHRIKGGYPAAPELWRPSQSDWLLNELQLRVGDGMA